MAGRRRPYPAIPFTARSDVDKKKPAPLPALNRKPWSMKWIVLAIVVCIVPYTWITLKYRKGAPPHLPYQDNKDRAQVMRLLDSGYQRVEVSLERLVDPPPPLAHPAPFTSVPGGLPPSLSTLLIDPPPVPSTFVQLDAPASSLVGTPYVLQVGCTQPHREEQAATSFLYLRGQEAVFIIGYDDIPGDLQARRLEAYVRLTVPANTFHSGQYRATLIGAETSRHWTFTVH